jgi:Fe-S-cluster-containing hydrogenase component 2
MALVINSSCIGCGACESACPQGAIHQSDNFIVGYFVDPIMCNDCNLCISVCPIDGFETADTWAVCYKRGCPLSSKHYNGWTCSQYNQRCKTCDGVLWTAPESDIPYCPVCDASQGHSAKCPKVNQAKRLLFHR